MSKFKVGDIVPYRNTRGNIKKAEITSFETVDNGKVWFHGIDTVPKQKSGILYIYPKNNSIIIKNELKWI